MFNIINSAVQLLYKLRDLIWSYPDLILGEGSLRTYVLRIYRISVPYSHFVSSCLIVLLVSSIFFNNVRLVFGNRASTLIEGVVMGADSQGNIQTLGKIDPLRASNIQLERDLGELIYEPMIKYEFDDLDGTAKIVNILAEDVVRIRQGADYQFSLKRDVYWHDGVPFTSNDVIATFEFVSKLDANNAYIRAIQELRWEKLDDYNLRVCTRSFQESTCEQSSDNPILSNFLELISVKIIPAHKIVGVDPAKIDVNIPELFRIPVGTGKYMIQSVGDNSILLKRNEAYHDKENIPSIEFLQFKLFSTFSSAVVALENGEIHTLSSVSGEFKRDLEQFPQINSSLSPVLYNQYWGMYFNLRKDPDGNTIGSKFFQDVNVRRAISMAINRDTLVSDALLGMGSEAIGPIPEKSEFFNRNAGWFRYDPTAARALLDDSGWTIKSGDIYRTNVQEEVLEFSLYFVDSYDRINVAKSIQNDLETIGIRVIIDRREQPGQDASDKAASGWSLSELNNQYLLPRTFDAILYGMYTFIDPDRYELFHSGQSTDPGLNISGYVGSELSVQVRPDRKEGESALITVPKVDRLLEETRALDSSSDAERRKQNYNEFQALLASDSPVVFLYQPQFIYYSHSRVKNVTLDGVSSLEDRFRHIEDWVL
jgi:peptide/nickel transport system substrate-binding protein